jgi:phosphoglycerol transferase MdoB-like AlkP superfamily enzyme
MNATVDYLRSDKHTLLGHGFFMLLSMLTLMVMFSLSRTGLYWYNVNLAATLSQQDVLVSFLIGLRFDLMVVCILSMPLLSGFLYPTSVKLRRGLVIWLALASSISILFCIAELDFYREFHQRLNSLVFEYIRQDPATVASMLWNGFPVFRYLLLWALFSWLMYRFYLLMDHAACVLVKQCLPAFTPGTPIVRCTVLVLVFLAMVLGARGTLRQGPPLRWGDAFHSQNLFANHLGLNGVFTLYKAAGSGNGKTNKKYWLHAMPLEEATDIVKSMLVTPQEELMGGEQHLLLRRHTGSSLLASERSAEKPNVVVILMESFSGAFTGALGNDVGITPSFDQIAKQGLLFSRFFSNGTHTHQGTFASLACFPNVPGYEYLMQEPEGTHKFSGLPLLLQQAGYQDMYIYNGSFSWDNQEGFFRNQSMTKFIGREDFVNPVFVNPTWGVSDQDMFDRAVIELANVPKDKPFFAVLQTLSNHTPYAMPTPLPVVRVTDQGSLNEHLTAMRYADWALGEFFKKIEHEPYYNNTIFVLLGDHGFGIGNQVTDIDLLRFRVPLLIIGPGVQKTFGTVTDRVATQIDIAPTVMGLLGDPFVHQCWGRDVLSKNGLPQTDRGFGLIKPSGNDEIVGFIQDDKIVVKRPDSPTQLYHYELEPLSKADLLDGAEENATMSKKLSAFVQRATQSLLDNTTGAGQ